MIDGAVTETVDQFPSRFLIEFVY